jgi:hypothetical protein
MPFREEVNYIAVDDEMPEHPKIEPLSDAAFRLLVTTWCYCSRRRNDGVMEEGVWLKRGTPKTRAELENAGMVKKLSDGRYEAHDYLDMQRSAIEVAALREKKSNAGKLGNHRRHHVARGIKADDCSLCLGVVA